MHVQESINRYLETYPKLEEERAELDRKIYTIISSKLAQVAPVIKLMREQNLYFYHPRLGEDVRTLHGAILGLSRRNPNQLYVFTGSGNLVFKVDTYDDTLVDDVKIPINSFLMHWDLEFVMESIEYLATYLDKALEKMQRTNLQRKQFIERYGEATQEQQIS